MVEKVREYVVGCPREAGQPYYLGPRRYESDTEKYITILAAQPGDEIRVARMVPDLLSATGLEDRGNGNLVASRPCLLVCQDAKQRSGGWRCFHLRFARPLPEGADLASARLALENPREDCCSARGRGRSDERLHAQGGVGFFALLEGETAVMDAAVTGSKGWVVPA